MTDITYNWKRYWVPPDGNISFDSQGFLLPPASDAKWARWWKTDVVSFDELLTKPCLILLGEPGIGKSFAIRDSQKREQLAKRGADATFLFRDLGSYNSDSLLVEEVFKSPEFTNWEKHGGELHIFLDSFDECLLRVDAVANLLAEQFNRLTSVENLFVRITSRTAEWQTSLEDTLRAKWGKDQVGVYELAPLTRDQVVEAAKLHVTSAEKFARAIVASEVVSFAIKPLTLDLLIRVWLKRQGSLPPTQREIYEQGCLQLCTETEKRQTPKMRRSLSAEERLAMASHIAAGVFFCNHVAVWTGSRLSAKPESDVALSDLTYGHVSVQGRRVQVTQLALREALDSGLFTSRGRDRLGWAHQTYGEFLAARYLTQEAISYRQINDLFVHPHDSKRRLIPQLQEAAAWVAGENRALFEQLARTQPEVLLRSDVATADDQTKSALVDALLKAIGMDSVQGDWWAMRARYRKLRHSLLARQLRRYICDQSMDSDTRVEAIHIADACELTELLPDLTKVALNTKQPQPVREWAAGLVSRKGDKSLKKRLKPLALGKGGNDPHNELRGAALKACWPEHISAKELFGSIKVPDRRFGGLYKQFISQELIKGLKPSDLPVALAWAEVQDEEHIHSLGGYEGLVQKILDMAGEHIETASVLSLFARALLARLRMHDSSIPGEKSSLIQKLEASSDLRLKLAEAIILHFDTAKDDSVCITHFGLRLVTGNDFEWVVSRLQTARESRLQEAYAYMLGRIFYPSDAARANKVIELSAQYPIVMDVLSCWLKPMDLNSDEVRKTRKHFYDDLQYREKAAQRRRPKLLAPLPMERMTALLDQFDVGDIEAWWKLCTWVGVEDTGRHCEKLYHMDIREMPGWKNATDVTKARMLSAAFIYVNAREIDPKEWFWKKNISHHPAVAGFRALLLLANESRAQFESLTEEVWRRWLPAILRHHYYDELAEHRLLLGQAFLYAPQEAVKWSLELLNLENKEDGNLWVLSKLPDVWSDELGKALLARAQQRKLKPQCTKQLLTELLGHEVPGALNFIRSVIPKRSPTGQSSRLTALVAIRLLMTNGSLGDWPPLWRLIKADATFGRELIEGLGHEFDDAPAPMLKTLTEADVGLLWEWMFKQYPIKSDPDRSQGGTVTTRWAMATLRDNLISHLANAGTFLGCAELRRLIQKYPQFTWFQHVLMRAEEQTRRNTWTPPLPSHLFKLTENRHARLVQSAAQLLDVIVDLLDALQGKLLGEIQLAQFLWDGNQPKPEEAISDWIAAFLEDELKKRGVVVGREVQIYRYDKTDVHVTAVAKDDRSGTLEHVKVIIEVKGCWHRELKTAMQRQLAERYLTKYGCQHGLYLVGWFSQSGWANSDGRRKRVGFSNIQTLKTFLADQSQKLSKQDQAIRAVVLDFSKRIPATRKRVTHNRKAKRM